MVISWIWLEYGLVPVKTTNDRYALVGKKLNVTLKHLDLTMSEEDSQ